MILISPQFPPIKTVDLNGKTPFPNKIRVKLFFRFNKTKLRDFEHFKLVLGDNDLGKRFYFKNGITTLILSKSFDLGEATLDERRLLEISP